MEYSKQIKIKTMVESNADIKAKLAETIVNNLTHDALAILAEKSKKPGISEKLKAYQNLI